MREFRYDTAEKDKCWYLNGGCNKNHCGDDFCPRHYKMCFLTSAALLDGKQKYSTRLVPDTVDLPAFKRLKEIQTGIADFVAEGKNLLIYSANAGNGKTSWTTKLLLSYFNSIWATTDMKCRGLFISMPRLVIAMKENITSPNAYFQHVNDTVMGADLVLWDELNYKEWTQFEKEYLLNVISQRINEGKSNIYTTNYTLQEIEHRLRSRLFSRIYGQSEHIEFKGKDKRGWGNN